MFSILYDWKAAATPSSDYNLHKITARENKEKIQLDIIYIAKNTKLIFPTDGQILVPRQ